ncbi:MAG: hypothetical protein IID39_04840, partial [Planctomycetes bacterium]|nr:hypothetical protein [Planctomycetota bacterium]
MLKWLLKTHKVFLVGALLATVVSTIFLGTRGLNKDYSLAAFVASDSEAYETFRQFMDEFVSNEFAVIAIQSDDAESEATIGLVKQLVSEVNSLEAVERVTSLADIPDLLRRAMGRRLREHPLIVDNLISRDGKTTAVLMQMAGEGATGAVRKETVARLKQIV